MVRRERVDIHEVTSLATLTCAFWRAARGRRQQKAVRAFELDLVRNVCGLRQEVLQETFALGLGQTFKVYDPKERTIEAPRFEERVLHHALMEHVGPILDRSLVDDTFACRVGKGALRAVWRAQQHVRRFPWYGKLDMWQYFASIDHEVLLAQLRRRLKGPAVLRLIERILARGKSVTRGAKGLPIGSLTSQHFANTYLGPLDRFLLDDPRVCGMVRYMDDALWFGKSADDVRSKMREVILLCRAVLRLEVKANTQVQRSRLGMLFCGFRVYPGTLKLSRRRMRRYRVGRERIERKYLAGEFSGKELVERYAAVHATTVHAAASAFRAEDLRQRPPVDV